MENNKTNMIALSVGLLVAGLVAGYMIGQSGIPAATLTTSLTPIETPYQTVTPKSSISTSPVSIPGWKTYRNDSIGVTLMYPDNLLLEHDAKDTIGTVAGWKKDVYQDFVISLWVRTGTDIRYWLGDAEPIGPAEMGGERGNRFEYIYGDGPGISPKTVSIVVPHNGKTFALVFEGDYTLDSTEQAILESFQFTN